MSLDFTLYSDNESNDVDNIYSGNYTHNVAKMWRRSGVYDALYNSEGKLAKDILPVLANGYEHMKENPSEYEELNPPNKWGSYEGALDYLKEVMDACRKYPNSKIAISK